MSWLTPDEVHGFVLRTGFGSHTRGLRGTTIVLDASGHPVGRRGFPNDAGEALQIVAAIVREVEHAVGDAAASGVDPVLIQHARYRLAGLLSRVRADGPLHGQHWARGEADAILEMLGMLR